MALPRASLMLLLSVLLQPQQAVAAETPLKLRSGEKHRVEVAEGNLQRLFLSALECDEETQALTHEISNKFNGGGGRYVLKGGAKAQ
mmetsp:Transcript_38332/g.101460  ORF Transcript_38332/g.101460 Transcript_38332/m.101460 type:complete len:87 (+) Transcript_38332:106-366(+)